MDNTLLCSKGCPQILTIQFVKSLPRLTTNLNATLVLGVVVLTSFIVTKDSRYTDIIFNVYVRAYRPSLVFS